jgi:membrane protein DedA with SNARE-associated domain
VVAAVALLVVLAVTTGLATDVRHLVTDIAKAVEHLFAVYGYPIVFLAVLGESAGLPLPGETILLIAGVEAQHGNLFLPVIWLLGAAAAIVGDNLGYLVGHYGGRPLLERYGRILRVQRRELRILDKYFEVHGAKTVFLGRWVIFLRVWAALFAGAARMEWKRFFFYNALGGTAWVISMSTLAYIFASSISRLKGIFGVLAWVLAFIVAGFVVYFVAREQRRSLEKYALEEDDATEEEATDASAARATGALLPDTPGDGDAESPAPVRSADPGSAESATAAPEEQGPAGGLDATEDGGRSPSSAP